MILDKSSLECSAIGRRPRFWLGAAAIAALAGAASPSPAQQRPSLLLPLPPADTGKPMVFDAPYRALDKPDAARGCAAALPCRLRLLGELRRNGAVELKATALTW